MIKSIASKFPLLGICLAFACNPSQGSNTQIGQDPTKPNIIYILADDLGYGDLGAFGSTKIETPNLDALAKGGMLFTQHYSGAPVCAPARYMLMTGQHSGHAYIRGNDEWRERDSPSGGDVWNFADMEKDSTLEGQRPLPEGTVLFPKRLQSVGYTTGSVGKWGLGAPQTNSIPTKMGFDFFYGYNCQRQAHTYYPVHLYKNENRVPLRNKLVAPSTKLPDGADPKKADSYSDFTQQDYAPDLMFAEMINFISENKDKPFYFYWATPIPHVALQAPQRWVDYYEKKFGEETPYLGNKGYFPHKNPRAAYAAMVSYLDENVGKLIEHLKKEGLYENTLIIFTSDNGPTFNGGTDSEWFNSAGPFTEDPAKIKGHVHEGGIRVPMIASWPGKIAPGTKSDLLSSHIDMMATFGEIAGYEVPQNDGISILPTLLGKGEQKQHEYLYWEFPEYGGQVAVRFGDWKLIRQHLSDNQTPTLELYNLAQDPLETTNLAKTHPEILAQAESIFNQAHQPSELEKFRIPLLEKGLLGIEK
ncbi:arylsulfatase [Algoriphagus aestuariicola]|uniref:Arylsulfatase n=1 Tax=Algoriphagus aestuariicola TaxID=1852016 RepID=A0ABS3BTL0_9BACT|nr:arylsulfatase [Algoriphagus aestuariicola]MBN7802216.1 arylsulfatase [Algoriphagus aestuariicola]